MLTGENTIYSWSGEGQKNGIKATNAGIVISGEGTLNVTARNYPIITSGNLTINSGSITVKSNRSEAIDASQVLINGGELTATATYGVEGTVKNAIPGIGWTDLNGTQGETAIPVSTEGQNIKSFRKVTFSAAAPAADLVNKHSISLNGNINLNFYMNPEVVSEGDVVTFTGLTETTTYTVDVADLTDLGYMATVEVPAAEMTYKITASVDGIDLIDEYSVRDYCDVILSEEYANAYTPDEDKPWQSYDKLVAVVQTMLDYGAKAQAAFTVKTNDLANAQIGYTMSEKTIDELLSLIDAAIAAANGNATADNMSEVAAALQAKYFTTSLIFLSKSTLRHYFTPTSYPGEMVNANLYDGVLGDTEYYYYVQKADIAAAELDDLQTFTVGDVSFKYSALDYVKAVLNSDAMTDAQKDLAKATYWYNQAANAYFDAAAPAPAGRTIVLDDVRADFEAQDGDVLTGVLGGDYKITIADGVTITLKDVTITCLSEFASFAGITPLGDATILLEGANTVKGGHRRMPGIYIPANKTLTIDGTGSLEAYSGGDFSGTYLNNSPASCGIGGKRIVTSGTAIPGGNLVINGGTITACGGNGCAGIGSCATSGITSTKMFGDITINGGTVTASGLDDAAGIGSGKATSCGNITITGGTVTATGDGRAAGIGSGGYGSCGAITIGGAVVDPITDSPYTYQPN